MSLLTELAETGLRIGFNLDFSLYGKMSDLNIDSKAKSASVTLMLLGEDKPITIKISNYSIDTNKSDLTIGDIEVSRPWLDMLAKAFVAKGPIALPGESANYLKLIL